MPISPKELVLAWVDAFNRADADALAAFYSEDATSHQVEKRGEKREGGKKRGHPRLFPRLFYEH